MNINPPQTKAADVRLKTSEYVGYALGDTASNLFFQSFGIFLTIFYTDVWGLAPAAVGTMFLVVRLFDASLDPLIGLMADRTQTRWGKFRPYILWFAIPFGLGGYLLFASPNLSSDWGKLLYAYLTYAFMMLMYSFINVPYSSLLGVISPSPRIRTLASSYRFVGAFGGGLLVTMFVKWFVRLLGGGVDEKTGKIVNELQGYQNTMLIFAVLAVSMFLVCFATTRERVKVPPGQKTNVKEELGELLHNYPWIMMLLAAIFSLTFIGLRNGSASYYFKYVVGDDNKLVLWQFDRLTVFLSLGMACQMLGSYCLSFFAKVADKRVLSYSLTIVTGICWGVFYVIPRDNFPMQLAIQALGSFCMGPASALVWAMYADVADYGEWKFGRRSTGLVYSASLFAIKTGTALAGLMLPWILANFDYVANVQQSPKSILGITLTFSLFPAGVAFLKAIALWIYPLSKTRVDEIEKELTARRAAANN